MKLTAGFLLAMASFALASPAAAARCYQNEDNPDWTVTINDPGIEPEMVWNQGGQVVELGTSGAGTGIPRRYAYEWNGDSEHHYSFLFVDEVLVFDLEIYRPGCTTK